MRIRCLFFEINEATFDGSAWTGPGADWAGATVGTMPLSGPQPAGVYLDNFRRSVEASHGRVIEVQDATKQWTSSNADAIY